MHINPDDILGLKEHGACPTRVRCLPIMGTVLAPDGQNCRPMSVRYIHAYSCFQISANALRNINSALVNRSFLSCNSDFSLCFFRILAFINRNRIR